MTTLATTAPLDKRRFGVDLSTPVLLVFAALLCVLIVMPLAWLAVYAFTDNKTGAFTLLNFKRLVVDAAFFDPLITTFKLATLSAIACCVVAAPMGWLVARTDMPLRRTVRLMVTASFVTPPFLGAIAWELLAAPNSGLLNQLFRDLTGARASEHLLNIYSFTGLVFVISCYTFPYVFVLVANALDRMPGDLEDASSILGGGTWDTARRITIPLALPALLAGALVAFLQAMTLFGSPAILALAGRFPHHDHQDLEPVPVSAQAGARRRRVAAVADPDRHPAARAAHGFGPARLFGGRRQEQRPAPGAARRLQVAGAGLKHGWC